MNNTQNRQKLNEEQKHEKKEKWKKNEPLSIQFELVSENPIEFIMQVVFCYSSSILPNVERAYDKNK